MSFFLHFFFHAFTGNTKHAAKIASILYHIPLEDFKVTYNGLDFNTIKPQIKREEIKRKLFLDDYKVIGTCSKFKEGKRIEILIKLIEKLQDDDIKLLLVGDGPETHKLQLLANELKVNDKIIFAGLQPDISNFVNAMDIFIFPSLSESFGNAAVEAMALGVPTIVFKDGGGVTEHIVSGKTGFIVEGFDDLLEKTKELIENGNLRKNIGKAGETYVKNKYSLSNMTKAYKNVYESIMNKSK